MTDRTKFNDDEYQFPGDDFMEDLHAESSMDEAPAEEPALITEKREGETQKGGLSSFWSNHKKLIIVIGVVAVVTLAFTYMRSTHKVEEAAPAPEVTQPEPVVSAPMPQTKTVIDPQIVNQLSALKQDASNNNATVEQLQRQVQQLDSTLAQERAARDQSNQSVLMLVDQVKQLSTDLKAATAKPVKKAAKKVVTERPITYQLRAVVPGRAWIVDSDGQSQSIAVGDQVPQYGVVQSIDAEEGIVITNSGKVIRFQ